MTAAPVVPGSGPVQRERRDAAAAKPLIGGARATDPKLTTRDVADRLGVSTNFVIGEIRDGRMAATVIERPGIRSIYRVSELGLQDYLRRHKWTSTDAPERTRTPNEPQP